MELKMDLQLLLFVTLAIKAGRRKRKEGKRGV